MQHVLATLLGAGVSFGVACLLVGPGQASIAVALAVICTGGLGLVPLLLLSYVVGMLLLWIFSTLQGLEGEGPPAGEAERIRALARYIRKARDRGRPEDATRRQLHSAGWVDEEIDGAERLCARWAARG